MFKTSLVKLLGKKWKEQIENRDGGVKVLVRFRPRDERDVQQQAGVHDPSYSVKLDLDGDHKGIHIQHTETVVKEPVTRNSDFTFDYVFSPEASQLEVYEMLAGPIVEEVVQGYNGTILAYGQTGSGKTYTMFGQAEEKLQGVIPRAAEDLFSRLRDSEFIISAKVTATFIEIYKEHVKDLLAGYIPTASPVAEVKSATTSKPSARPTSSNLTSPPRKPAVPAASGNLSSGSAAELKIRETPAGQVYVEGLTDVEVTSVEQLLALIREGEKRRTTGKTAMNDVSSRSHSLLTLAVTQKLKDASIRTSKLNLADLAGSERVKKSLATDEALAEAQKINLSLSSLGNCINALTEKNRLHVPYRDSKLTFLLQDSLGGNTKTTLMINCSSHPSNVDETVSSLKFGARAKLLKNKPRINSEVNEDVNELRKLVNELRGQLAAANTTINQLRVELDQTRAEHGAVRGHDTAPALADIKASKDRAAMFKKRRPRRRRSLPASFKPPNLNAADDFFIQDNWKLTMNKFPWENYVRPEDVQRLSQSNAAPSDATVLEAVKNALAQEDPTDAAGARAVVELAQEDEKLAEEFNASKREVEDLLASILGKK